MIYRNISNKILESISDNPAVLLHGARQTGKSTLIKWLIQKKINAEYINLDELGLLSMARSNPIGFLNGFKGTIAIDEVQRAPELFLAMKREIDNARKPGRFILTGSANVLLIPRISESLAGRIEILTLYPLAQCEIEGDDFSFIDEIFSESKDFHKHKYESCDSLTKRICNGGYPEILKRENKNRKDAWFRSYVTTILQRDLRDIANIEGINELPKLLSLLAARTGSILNFAELSRTSTIPQTTLKRYLNLLQSTFLIHLLPAWSSNLSKRLIKTPKIYLCDSGLTTHLIGANEHRLASDGLLMGHTLESFVLMELLKHLSWSTLQPRIYYLRTTTGHEVDFVLELPNERIIGIEVKASATINPTMFEGLKLLRDELGKKFLKGILLYTGNHYIPMDKNIFAIPVSTMWKSID